MNILGFDLGGTKSAAILAKVEEGQIEIIDRIELRTIGLWQEVLDDLGREAEKLITRYGWKTSSFSIGISCGGPLDAKKGILLSPPNLPGWDNVPVVAFFEEMFKMPARLQNDADACALAEWKYGAGKGAENMIFLTFGTGLGAGLILNGKLYRGASNMAGEVGHIRLEEDGPIGYGKKGSFEGYCSGGGIAQIAKKKAEELEKEGKRASYQHKGLDAITTKDVAKSAEEGNEDALDVFRISGHYFGKGLAILIDILNPELIVAGSVFLRAGKFMKEEMNKVINEEALHYSSEVCQIKESLLGEEIGDYGAVITALSGDW
ncbi:MAG: ROK family protein [Clostridiaceae bacterium]